MRHTLNSVSIAILVSALTFAAVSCGSTAESRTEPVSPGDPMRPPAARDPAIVQQTMDDTSILPPGAYEEYALLAESGPVIPGLFQSAVPQGMAYLPDPDLMFVSSYMSDGRASVVSVISMTDGQLLKNLWLENPDGTPHKGHVGGLATSIDNLWIASGAGVYRASLAAIARLPDDSTLRTEYMATAVKGSFATSSEGVLWVGEFASRDGAYNVEKSHHMRTPSGTQNHGWLAGFVLDQTTGLPATAQPSSGPVFPDYILSIPDEVQGAAFVGTHIVLSRSYGRTNDSRLSVFENPLGRPPDQSVTAPDAREVPVWILDDKAPVRQIIIPPMSEGIVDYGGRVAILFESASEKYRSTARFPQDRIAIVTLPGLR